MFKQESPADYFPENLIYEIMDKATQQIEEKYPLRSVAVGTMMPDGIIKMARLVFDTKNPLTKDELRSLVILCAQRLLEEVNKTKEVFPYLEQAPFTIKNINITIHNKDVRGEEVYDPGISVASITRGSLVFRTTDSNDIFHYKDRFEETYEEALKLVSEQNFPVAIDPKDKQDAKKDLRILKLIPNLLCRPLAVDPGIPEDFVALSPRGTLDPSDWIYWGPKDVLKAYFENPSSLKTPVLRVKLSANMAQTGPNSFNHESSEEFRKMLNKIDPEGVFVETRWGDNPVRAVKMKMDGQLIFTAWVGLNDPQGGWILMFNLVYPDQKDHPNKEDHELWDNFITNTTQLKDGDAFKSF